jgi:peptidyl-prolyl cis-trans isomerase D
MPHLLHGPAEQRCTRGPARALIPQEVPSMLEQLRQNSRSLIIWVLFGIIIVSFIVTFGSQADVNMAGCGGGSSSYAMVVDDQDVSVHSWRFGMATMRAGADKAQRAQRILDSLLKREILAQAARDAGFRVTTDMATDLIRNGEFLVMGMPVDGKGIYYRNGYFDYSLLQAQVNAMGLPSIDQFIAEQQRELEAEMMRDLLLRGAVASPEEARARYVYESTTAIADVVQLRASEYQRKITLSPEQIDRYRQEHESEVRAKYDADAALYKGRGKEVKIRHIFVERKQPATIRHGETDGGTPPEDTDPGLQIARQARERILAGADFGQVASEVSEEERSKSRGGSLGWRSQENPGLGVRELADAVKTLEVGAVSEVITSTRGYHVLKLDEMREGDLSYEQVAGEIAEQMAVQAYAKAAARRDAQRALERAKAALAEGKKLEDVFKRQQPPPSGFESLPPEIQEQLRQQMEKQGSLTPASFDGPDRPAEASWQGGAQPAVPGDQPAPAPAAAGQGDQAGQAGAPAAGAPAEGAAVTATGAPAASAEPAAEPVGEDIPVPEGLVEPEVRRVGPFTRDAEGLILGVGKSEELMKLIFTELEDNQLTDEVYEVSESFVFVQLVSRQDPNLEDFQKDQLDRTQLLGMERGYGELQTWLQSRCKALVEGKQIGINRELMNQLATEREGEEFTYQPNCAGL